MLPFTKSARESDQDRRDGLLASPRVADRLASARRRRFVGREAEIETFRAALLADEPPFVALHITGAGGVGKTTLLQELARVARDAGRAVVRIDGRNIEPSATGFLVALRHALGVEEFDLPAMLERWPAGGVLLVDTYELLAPIDDWLRQTPAAATPCAQPRGHRRTPRTGDVMADRRRMGGADAHPCAAQPQSGREPNVPDQVPRAGGAS